MKKLKPYIFYIIALAVFAVWFIVGAQFLTSDTSGAECFFLVSLPFLGFFGVIGLGLFKYLKTKLKADKQNQNKEKRK